MAWRGGKDFISLRFRLDSYVGCSPDSAGPSVAPQPSFFPSGRYGHGRNRKQYTLLHFGTVLIPLRLMLDKRLPVGPRSEGGQTPQNSPSTSPDDSTSKSISLSIFCIVAVLVCVATWCMTRRKAALRQRRRERALSEYQEMVGRRAFVAGRGEKGAEPPVMYQVCLEQINAEDGGWGYGEKDIGWKDTMPISTSLMPLVDRNSSMALEDPDHQIDPHLGIPVSQLSTLAELSSRQQ